MSLQAEIEFSLLLLQQSSVDQSVVISPLSVALAYAMVHAGAGGKSKDEIRQVIAKDGSDKQLLEYYKFVGETLLKKSDVQVKLANRIFIKDSFKIKESYLDNHKKNFDAKAVNLDFSNRDKSSKIVNHFVDEATGGKIKDIVKPDNFKNAVFLLISAIYFHGEWECRLIPTCSDRDFYVKKGVTKKVTMLEIPFMNKGNIDHPYVETDELQMLCLNYNDTNFQIIVVLPKKRFGLAEVRKNLTAEKLSGLLSRLHPHVLQILMPKFKIETTTPLVDILKKLGIKEAFTSSADLDGIARGVFISDVKHKAFIEVTESSPNTDSVTTCFFEKKNRRPITSFIADHPFPFFVSHQKNIVMCGQYNG